MWCSLGENIGVEMNGKGEDYLRPVLVIKVFNKKHVWVLPFSSQDIPKYHINLSSLTPSEKVVISQLRTVSTLRLYRYITKISVKDFHFVIDSVIDLLKYRTPILSDEGSSRPLLGSNEVSIKQDKNNAT
jgi:mRNA interferase MazF